MRRYFSKLPIIIYTIAFFVWGVFLYFNPDILDIPTILIFGISWFLISVHYYIFEFLNLKILKENGVYVCTKRENSKDNHVYILNVSKDPICGVSVHRDGDQITYVVGFSKYEKNVYVLDPKTGKGVKLFGYSDKSKPEEK